jgi:hypothetical protein
MVPWRAYSTYLSSWPATVPAAEYAQDLGRAGVGEVEVNVELVQLDPGVDGVIVRFEVKQAIQLCRPLSRPTPTPRRAGQPRPRMCAPHTRSAVPASTSAQARRAGVCAHRRSRLRRLAGM